jgi:hypothetical protein
VSLEVPSPAKGFTVQQDLERNCVWIFGQKWRAKVMASLAGVEIYLGSAHLATYPTSTILPQEEWERLSFGSRKVQDWDQIWRRGDLREILPSLFALGQRVPPLSTSFERPDCSLLEFCRAALHHILVPRPFDDQYQGIAWQLPSTTHPFAILVGAYQWIRSLFIRQEGHHLHLLPAPPFTVGRMTRIKLHDPIHATLDLEMMQKSLLRRLILRPTLDTHLFLHSPHTHFRLRSTLYPRGKVLSAQEPLSLQAGHIYCLDRFMAAAKPLQEVAHGE